MKLPWPSRDPVAHAVTEPEPSDVARPPVAAYTSPGLEAAFDGLPSRRSCRVLELGPAVGDNLTFASAAASRLEVVDLARDAAARGRDAASAIERNLSVLLDLEAEHRGSFHLVLAWDLLNYLPRPRVAELSQVLARLCAARGRLFATFYEGETMPLRPCRYRISGATRLLSESVTNDVTGAPDLPPAEVEKLLEGFRIERSFVLRHGAREYIATASICE